MLKSFVLFKFNNLLFSCCRYCFEHSSNLRPSHGCHIASTLFSRNSRNIDMAFYCCKFKKLIFIIIHIKKQLLFMFSLFSAAVQTLLLIKKSQDFRWEKHSVKKKINKLNICFIFADSDCFWFFCNGNTRYNCSSCCFDNGHMRRGSFYCFFFKFSDKF